MAETFAESLLSYLKDKKVEVYANSSAKEREYADFSVTHKEVIRGVMRDARGDVILIEVTDKSGRNNIVYVNGWSVTAVMEPKNGMSIVDVYCDEYEKQVK